MGTSSEVGVVSEGKAALRMRDTFSLLYCLMKVIRHDCPFLSLSPCHNSFPFSIVVCAAECRRRSTINRKNLEMILAEDEINFRREMGHRRMRATYANSTTISSPPTHGASFQGCGFSFNCWRNFYE